MKLRSRLALLSSLLLLGFLAVPAAQAQTPNPLAFGTPHQLYSGSFFPLRVVANITHPDPNDPTKDVVDPIDFDGDGNSDFAEVEASQKQQVTVWLRQADGSYTNVQFIATAAITDLAVADMNGDGKPDLIVAAGGSVYVYTNDGVILHDQETTARLSFTLAATLASSGDTLQKVAVTDLNGDGLLDILATSTFQDPAQNNLNVGHVVVFMQTQGVNNFAAGVTYTVPFGAGGAGAIATGPLLNADFIPDVVVSDPNGQSLVILPGNGDGTLSVDTNPNHTNLAVQALLTHTAVAIALADVDGDGRRDIFTAGYGYFAVNSNPAANHLTVDFLHNNSHGFDAVGGWEVDSVAADSAQPLATDLAVGDFNLDGTLDVAVADSINGGVAILLGAVNRDSSGAFASLFLSLPVNVTAGAHTQTVSAANVDGDTKLDLVTGNNDSEDVVVLLNAGTPAPPVLSGKKVQFDVATATYVKMGEEAFIVVRRASDSTGKIIVPFTVGGTAIPDPKAHSDYFLDSPANKKLVFEDGVFEQDISIAITGDAGSQQNATIILTLGNPTDALGKPTMNAVLGPIKSTTLTLTDFLQPTLHAANALSIKPSIVLPATARELAQAGVKGFAYDSSPWTFTVSQTADAAALGLSLQLQCTTDLTAGWTNLGDPMHRIKPGSPIWTTTTSDVPAGSKVYFRVESSASGYTTNDTAAAGPYWVFQGPKLTLTATQCPYPLASNSNNFTTGKIDTHNSEGITYHFEFRNTGSGPAPNVAVDIPLPPLTHFGGATTPHIPGNLIQLDRRGKPTSSNLDTVALRYTYQNFDSGAFDYADVVVDVISANEYNPKYQGASFGLQIGMHAFRISASVDISTTARTTVYGTPTALTAVIRSPLTATMQANQTIASPGGLIVYTATLKNTAAVAYKEAVFTATLPFGVALESVDLQGQGLDFTDVAIIPTGGTNPSVSPYPFQFGNLQTLTWKIGTIPAGQSVQVVFTVRAQYDLAPVVIDGPTTSHTNEIDLTDFNLVATPPTGGQIRTFQNKDGGVPARTLVSAADPEALPQIGFVKEAIGMGTGGGEITEDGLAVATVLPGDDIEYRLHYFNTGGSKAHGCVIQEQVPANATFVGFVSINGVSPDPNQYVFKDGLGKTLPYPNHTLAQDLTKTRQLEYHLGDLAAGDGGYVSYRVAATAAANTHILSKDYRMYTESLSQAIAGKPVQVPAKVVLPISFDINTKANKFEVSPGELITYTVRFRNNGGIAASNVVVSCPLPPGANYVSARFCDESKNTIGGTVNPPTTANKNTISFNVGTLVPEEAFTDVNGNGFHDAGEPYADTNVSSQHNNAGEGLVEFTVQVQNPLPLSLRLPNTMLAAKASIVGMYPRGALVHASALRGPSSERFAADASSLLGTPTLLDEAHTRIKDPARANLWGLKTAPQFVTKGQKMIYRIVAGNSGNVAVNNVQIAIQVPYGTTLDTKNSSPGAAVVKGIVYWQLGNLAAHGVDGRALVVTVNANAAYQNDTLEENSCFLTSKTVGSALSNSPDCVPGPSRTTVLSSNPVVSAWQSFGAWLGSLGGNIFGHGNANLEQNVHQFDNGTVQTTIRGADVIVLQNGVSLIQNGGGNIVAAGGGNLISQDGGGLVAAGGGNLIGQDGGGLVAAGGGNIVAAGGGNLISVQGIGFLTQSNLTSIISGIVAQGGGNIVAQGGGNIVAAGGGNLIGQDGTSLIGLDGSPIVAAGGGNFSLLPQGPGLVAAGGGNLVAAGGGNIVAAGGGNIVAQGGGNLVAAGGGNVAVVNPNGAGIVAAGGGNIVAQGGGNIVAQGAGNIVAQGGGN